MGWKLAQSSGPGALAIAALVLAAGCDGSPTGQLVQSGCVNNVVVVGSNNTTIVENCTGAETETNPLGFTCVTGPTDSTVVCRWNDEQFHDLVATNPSYGQRTEHCDSPCEIDPVEQDTEARTHNMTLREAGVVIAGPIPVETLT